MKGRATVDARSNSDRSPLYDVRNHASRCSGQSKGLRNDVFADDVVTGASIGKAAGLPSRSSRQPVRLRPLGSGVTASLASRAKAGGARRDRTDDLMLAKHALSQLSYGPVTRRRMLHVEVSTRSSVSPSSLLWSYAGHASHYS